MEARINSTDKFEALFLLKTHPDEISGLTLSGIQKFIKARTGLTVAQTTLSLWIKTYGFKYKRKGMTKKDKSQEIKQINIKIKSLARAIHELYDDIGSKQHPAILHIIDELSYLNGDK